MINLNYKLIGSDTTITHCFLHGFLGNLDEWDPIISLLPNTMTYLLIDLPGHGKSRNLHKDNYSYSYISDQIIKIKALHNIKDITLTGYSMGGRIALSIAKKIQAKTLILESSSLGLKTEGEKKNRYQNDLYWANIFETTPLKTSLTKWYDQNLFSSVQNKENLINDRLDNCPKLLSQVIKSFSVAKMPYLEEKLFDITEIAYISGKKDKKYTILGQYIKDKHSHIYHFQLSKTGHNCHLENPEIYSKIWLEFMNTI